MSAVSILALAAGVLFLLLVLACVGISFLNDELLDAKITIRKLCPHYSGERGDYPECVGCPFSDECRSDQRRHW